MSNEINNLQQRERERLYYYLFIVTDVQVFTYEKLWKGFGVLAEVLTLKVLSGLGVSGGLHNPCTPVTVINNYMPFSQTPRQLGLPAVTYAFTPP